MKLSFAERLMFNTVRIQCTLTNGKSIGTGFLFNYETDAGNIPFLVTNKHVINGAIKGTLDFNTIINGNSIGLGHIYSITLENFERGWIMHPDPNVDLCIYPIAPILKKAEDKGVNLVGQYLGYNDIPSTSQINELDVVEDILMVGYPIGLLDENNNLPIFRKGTTATHPAIDFRDKKEFMIDCACFPGSSGSPVVLYHKGYHDKRTGQFVSQERFYLMGILYAGPYELVNGDVKIGNIPTRKIVSADIRHRINLGFVIKAETLYSFKNIIDGLPSK
jgi:V8-like Glu-specific endopeptidase